MKPFLILQLREIDQAADDEFEAFMTYGKLQPEQVHRIRMEKELLEDLDPSLYAGVILGGGPSNVSDEPGQKTAYQLRFEKELDQLYPTIFSKDIPYLGSCYGLGSVVRYAGGLVSKDRYSEPVGSVIVKLNEAGNDDPLLKGLPNRFTALCGHKEACQAIPEGGVLLGSSETCPVQLVRFRTNIYAAQFHCELDVRGLVRRIHYYQYHGYFNPEAADDLSNKTRDVVVEVPQMILERFVKRYRSK